MVMKETKVEASQAVEDVSRDEPRVIDIFGSPQISDAMIHEANILQGRSYEGIHGATKSMAFWIGLSRLLGRMPQGLASVLHHEAFLRIREEHKAEVRDLTEKNDTYNVLSEKLQANLVTSRDEHAEMAEQVFRVLHDSEDELETTTNDPILQVRQRLEQIRWLQTQVDVIHAEVEEFKKNIDVLTWKKETIQAQLKLIETQLRVAKEKASVQVEKIKELQSWLDVVVSDKACLANELEVARSEVTVARSEVVVANTNADAKVAQFRVDIEAIQSKARVMVDHAKWKAQSEALEGVHAQGFDIAAEIKNAKAEEAMARRLAFLEEDSESSSESEDGENPEDGDTTSDEDQAT
ncbi:uncharacterized protein [Nicotiana tomentosiformis]|uniref:uncharacterized protein n=1 Tax=Nicotiana tomentosiformis TaxID=4098 RepID=UPI00388C635E